MENGNGPNGQREFKGRTDVRLGHLERFKDKSDNRLLALDQETATQGARIGALEDDMNEVKEAVRETAMVAVQMRIDMGKALGKMDAKVSGVTATVRTWGTVVTILIALFTLLITYNTFIRDNGTRAGAQSNPACTEASGHPGDGQ